MALDKFKNFLSGKDDSVNDSDEEYYNEEVATDSENKMILFLDLMEIPRRVK